MSETKTNVDDHFRVNGAYLDFIVAFWTMESGFANAVPLDSARLRDALTRLEFYADQHQIAPNPAFVAKVNRYLEGSDEGIDFDQMCIEYLGEKLPSGDREADLRRQLTGILNRFKPSGKPH